MPNGTKTTSKASDYSETHPLSPFMTKPNGVTFETQEPGEKVLLLMRQHPVMNVVWIVITLGLIVVPTIVAPLFFAAGILPKTMPVGFYLILPLLWYLGTIGYALTNFLHWYYNIYILTDQRVVDIDWISLLYKRVSSAQLEKIQDVAYKQGGVLDSFFDYGTVFIQTAGTDPNFEFEAVPAPYKVVKEINSILEQKQKGQ